MVGEIGERSLKGFSLLTPHPGVPDIQERIDRLFSLIGGLLRSLRERGKTTDA